MKIVNLSYILPDYICIQRDEWQTILILEIIPTDKGKRHSIEQVANAVEIAIHKLPHMENLYGQVTDQIDKMQDTRQELVNDISGFGT